ncbi:MAG: histidine kinase N-terminal domain-containing protein [Chloroflexi bacterium]|nr:histidine kinase N-terminal domain-containing protein [Chloroflexota bacterium]
MDNAVRSDVPLLNSTHVSLDAIARVLPLLADINRADILICETRDAETARVVAHARPHSIAPVYRHALVGQLVTREESVSLFRAMTDRQYARGLHETVRDKPANGEGPLAPTVQEAYPIENGEGKIIGALLIETNLLESERLRRRSEVFQRMLSALQLMALRGEPQHAETLTAFGEYDGIIIVDADRVIRYMSGIATNLYRNIGFGETLIGKHLEYLELKDDELVHHAMEMRACMQVELEERGRTWIKQVVPLTRAARAVWLGPARAHLVGAMILIHDDTESRQRARELAIKTTMIKEMHHRVKNDLQTVASLLRMQSRQMQTTEAKTALGEATNRILSVAHIHEFLSLQDSSVINIRELAQKILQQREASVLEPAARISLSVSGPNIYLSARQATSCALVINELLQNALEHGYDARAGGGSIALTFQDFGDAVGLSVHDDGYALPENFKLQDIHSLGLRIVQMLVTEDLKGQFELQSDHGVTALVRFPKIPLGGEDAWKELE